ncbi:hypothetical protein [Chroococcidiopsis cubana]|uniref:hypothetical protein n=1 Tax=Chroococcidiopsis cubana TaxID=171392 RepID=UPI000F8E2D93|nr:hypothetical protein [Chroococcidiopsis cubana]
MTVALVTTALFTACTPTPIVRNDGVCRQQPQSPECKELGQGHHGGGFIRTGSGRSGSTSERSNTNSRSSRVSPNSPRTQGSPFFGGKTGFGSFGRGGFGLG